MDNRCPICGEMILVSPLSQKLGLPVWKCTLCEARYALGCGFVVLAGALIYSFFDALWAWLVALLSLSIGAYLLDRSFRRRK